jgi:Flp pilus assembly protein TadD
MATRSLFFALATALLCGCASLPSTPEARARAGTIVEIPPSTGLSLREAGITTLNASMRRFLASEVTARDDLSKLNQLSRAVIENPSFRIEYHDATRTAAETYETLHGNCLSFTNLFVALAREAGIEIAYQEVDVPPTWTMQGDSFVVSRHVNAVATIRGDPSHVVDFNMTVFRAAFPRRAISDERAAAHYYSNLGVERLDGDDAQESLGYFLKALAMDRTLPQAWINLGAWYRRRGDLARAEASYLEALRLAPRDHVAMGNLASLHAVAGRHEIAQSYRRRITQYRLRNPYYRYEQAVAALRAGDLRAASRHVRSAIRTEPDDPTFHELLGAVYRAQGRTVDAREAFERALALSDDPSLRTAMRRKLELLAGDGG